MHPEQRDAVSDRTKTARCRQKQMLATENRKLLAKAIASSVIIYIRVGRRPEYCTDPVGFLAPDAAITSFPDNPELNPHPITATPATVGAWVVMRWPPSSSKSTNHDSEPEQRSSASSSSHPAQSTNNTSSLLDWAAFTEPRTLIPTLLLTSSILLAVRFHRQYLRRFPDAPSISPSFLRRRSVFGQVTSVGDGDNFRIYHTPGGRLAGWGWLPWKKVPANKKELKDNTVRPFHFPVLADTASRLPLLPPQSTQLTHPS